MEKYDIIVIGGGPAGAVFSYFIDPKYRVLLLEKRDYGADPQRIKSCGGLLNETAQGLLSSLGYGLPTSILVDPQIFHVRVLDRDSGQSRRFFKGYLNIDREKLDDYLLSRSENEKSNLTVTRGSTYHDFQRINNRTYRIRYRTGGILKYAETKVLVGADGANSQVAREIVPNIKNICVSIQKRYKKAAPMKEFFAILDSRINDYYSWVIPKEDEVLLGSVFPQGKNIREKFDLLEASVREKEGVLGDLIREEGTFLKRPRWETQFIGHGSFGLVGEAAGFISPSSSEGISYALKSGWLLAKNLNKYGLDTGIAKYASACKSITTDIRMKFLKSKLLYTPWIRSVLLRTGIHADPEL
ncbi:MAG: FAD-dependent oxidoreductase [Fusobacteriaceae bacterium]|jgi:flavin-dependent dehydrogenase|nr:FAD-dependent oxidoreductase [Fusobacteriaceae bacterium]